MVAHNYPLVRISLLDMPRVVLCNQNLIDPPKPMFLHFPYILAKILLRITSVTQLAWLLISNSYPDYGLNIATFFISKF
jgi:hypothetical protein